MTVANGLTAFHKKGYTFTTYTQKGEGEGS